VTCGNVTRGFTAGFEPVAATAASSPWPVSEGMPEPNIGGWWSPYFPSRTKPWMAWPNA